MVGSWSFPPSFFACDLSKYGSHGIMKQGDSHPSTVGFAELDSEHTQKCRSMYAHGSHTEIFSILQTEVDKSLSM